jgi:hypothetical protein
MLLGIANFIDHAADRHSWTILLSIWFGCFIGFLDFIIDGMAIRLGVNTIANLEFQSLALGVTAGLLPLVILTARRERRRVSREELSRVLDLNNRLRNSLQIIAYANFAGQQDEEHQKVIFNAIAAMEATLQQLFPKFGVERRSRFRQQVPLGESPSH